MRQGAGGQERVEAGAEEGLVLDDVSAAWQYRLVEERVDEQVLFALATGAVRHERRRRRVRVERARAHVLRLQLGNVRSCLAGASEAGCARVDPDDVAAELQLERRHRLPGVAVCRVYKQ